MMTDRGHVLLNQQDVILDDLDRAALAVSMGEWPMPAKSADIDERWLDSFIATRLADVCARRYFGQAFRDLSVVDRTRIRLRVEFFVAGMTTVLGGKNAR